MEIELRTRLVSETPYPVAWGASLRDASAPRVVMQRISGAPDYTLGGASGLEEARVQIDCLGTSYAEAMDVALAVEAALDGYRGTEITACWRESVRDLTPDAEEYLFRIIMDYRVQYERT